MFRSSTYSRRYLSCRRALIRSDACTGLKENIQVDSGQGVLYLLDQLGDIRPSLRPTQAILRMDARDEILQLGKMPHQCQQGFHVHVICRIERA